MGMYDHLNRIERAIESNRKQEELKETRTTQEQKIKYNLLSLLETEIQEAKNNGFDLYNMNIKDRIIDNIIKNQDTTYLHGKDFTRYFLNNNYYKTIKQVSNIQKEAEKPVKEYEKELKKASKEDLQKQKLQLQIEILEQKKETEKQKQNPVIIKENPLPKILKILSYILLAPFLIIEFFLIECAKEAGRTGGRRR